MAPIIPRVIWSGDREEDPSRPRHLRGKPTIRGLRISVAQVLKALAAGISEEELLREYPELESADIRAALAYAASLVEGERVGCFR